MQNPIIIPLNRGLNSSIPALFQEQGALLDCVNYEMTDSVGYRRIDGYEAYDGWIAGEITNYYRSFITDIPIGLVPSLVPGAPLYRYRTIDGVQEVLFLGVVLNYAANVLTFAASDTIAPAWTVTSTLDIDPAAGVPRIVAASPVNGMKVDPAPTWLTNMRQYSESLRQLIGNRSTQIVGLHWLRQNLVVARDTYTLTIAGGTPSVFDPGKVIGIGDARYLVVHRTGTGPWTLAVEPINFIAPTGTTVVTHGRNDVNITSTVVTSVVENTSAASDDAYLTVMWTPEKYQARGETLLKRAVRVGFNNGSQINGVDPKAGDPLALFQGMSQALFTIKNITTTSGSFAAGNAVGFADLVYDSSNSDSPRNYLSVGDVLTRVFNSSDSAFTVTSVAVSRIAGSKALRRNNTRYSAITANFYGQVETTEAYGATGASRAFWVNANSTPIGDEPSSVGLLGTLDFSWGNIYARDVLDVPKYVSFHSGVQLALAYDGGSVQLSVPGEPMNYSGAQGALEITTGDGITGLLEGVNDTTIIFGRRSIRRIIGTTDADLLLKTISGSSGAYDYTAVLVGATPVFANPSGISTLEQTETYGDFTGQRVTYAVTNVIQPILQKEFVISYTQGPACAIPVRSKNQYRLFLKSGEVYSVCFAQDGPKVMKSDYRYGISPEGGLHVPFAWSSQVSEAGQERIHVAWDARIAFYGMDSQGRPEGPNDGGWNVFELDRGWGFNGARFGAKFDIAHQFVQGGTHHTGITKVRMYGLSQGVATLDLKTASIQDDFDMPYHNRIQDISLPRTVEYITPVMRNATSIVDSANTGLGIKIGIYTTPVVAETYSATEPSHVVQVLVCETAEGGRLDG